MTTALAKNKPEVVTDAPPANHPSDTKNDHLEGQDTQGEPGQVPLSKVINASVNVADHVAEATQARLLLAYLSFMGAALSFFGAIGVEFYWIMTAPEDETFDWRRSIIVVTAGLFSLALLKAAHSLSVPIELYTQIELQRALSKTPPLADAGLRDRFFRAVENVIGQALGRG